MAVQHGPIQLTGQLGGVSYYEMAGRFYARRKTAHSAERIRTDPAFKPTHQNSLEFGRASKASKLLRKAWKELGGDFADNRMYSRLNGCFKRVIQGDTLHSRGDRTVMDGDFTRLLDFELNKHKPFHAWCPSKPVVSVKRNRGQVALSLPQSSGKATVSRHVPARLVIGIAVIDFKKETHHVYRYECKLADFVAKGSLDFKAPLSSDTRNAVIITLGVSHPDTTGKAPAAHSTSMAIISVDAPTPAHRAPVKRQHHLATSPFKGGIRIEPALHSRRSPVETEYALRSPFRAQLLGCIRCRSSGTTFKLIDYGSTVIRPLRGGSVMGM